MYHLDAYSHLYSVPLIRNAYLFVDFFFVLSGFVIAANYEKRLMNGFGYGRFALLRFGRLYPLHLFVLACYVGFEMLKLMIARFGVAFETPAFSGHDQSGFAVVTNLLLLQGLGVNDGLTWNHPSWSISTEFFAYLLFAAALATLRERVWIWLLIAVLIGPVLVLYLSPRNMDATFDFGMIRCVAGFSAGALTYRVFDWLRRRQANFTGTRSANSNGLWAHAWEFATLGGAFLFVWFAATGPWSVVAPYVFSVVVLVFAFEHGSISRILKRPAVVLLGGLSYSIYMVHAFAVARMETLGHIIERVGGVRLFTVVTSPDGGELQPFFGTSLWLGDLSYAAMLVTVIVTSYFTYRFVEEPGRRWFRRLAA
jgi:peptidoglycan/LPS O-acetylase OafA/YrhL